MNMPLTTYTRNQIIIGSVLLVVAFVLAAGVISFYTHAGFRAYVEQGTNALFLPNELKGAMLAQKTAAGTRVLVPSWFGYAQVEELSASTTSFAHKGDSVVSVRTNGDTYEVVFNNTVVAASDTLITNASLSEDGKKILFSKEVAATSTVSSSKNPATIVRPVQFDVLSVNVASDSVTSPAAQFVAPGTSPLFLAGTQALYFTLGGVVRTDLADREASGLVLAQMISSLRLPAYVSPDATHVAWYDLRSKTLEVYKIGTSLEHVSSLSFAQVRGFAMGNEGIYELNFSKKGTEVWKRSFTETESRLIYTFPASLGVTQLVF